MDKFTFRTLMVVAFVLGCLTFSSISHAQQNIQGSLLVSAARTATANSSDRDNVGTRGIHVIVNISAYTSGTFTPTIQGKDPITGTYYTILAGTALNSTGTTILKVYPGITAAANASASDFIPKTWRVSMVGASTPVATFSVGFFAEY